MRAVGIILIVAGVLMLVFRGFNFTQQKKVADIGPLEINKKEKKSVNWPAYAGGIAIAAGAIVLVAGKKKA
jgi:drug/metabolite transporter (DMT)-like permease